VFRTSAAIKRDLGLKEIVPLNTQFLNMAEAPATKKRKRGNPNRKTGLIGVFKNGKRYTAQFTTHYLGTFATKEQAGIAFDRAAIDKSTEEISFNLNYPNMTDPEREEALKVEPPKKKTKRGTPNLKTGLIGVAKNGTKYQAYIQYGGKQHTLGTYDTKEQAGIAFDRAAIDKSTKEITFALNYPNMTDPEREAALKVEPVQKKKRTRGTRNQKTGLIGVSKSGKKKYKSEIWYNRTKDYLGTFDTKEQAGIAYDRVAIDQSTEEVSYALNYPNMTDPEREAALKVEPVQKIRGKRNQKTGLIGVSKKRKKYKAQIKYGGTSHFLGAFDTKEQAGMAYDRFVVDKSTDKVSFTLNYPNGLPTSKEPEAELNVKSESEAEPDAAFSLLLLNPSLPLGYSF
jgi:serine protease inhibitor ecotin